MAQQINQVVIGGNLTRDPELRSLPSGTSVCSLRIANNRRRKVGEEWTDVAGYFDVTCWGRMGENVAKYMAKGRPVMVRGELRWREWEDKQGNKRQSVEINADEVQFLGDGKQDGGSNGGSGYREDFGSQPTGSDLPSSDTGYREPAPAAGAPNDDSDIPFHNDGFPSYEERCEHRNR